MDTVTLAITLPQRGTAFDYAQAISAAISQQSDGIAQLALGNLLACIHMQKMPVAGIAEHLQSIGL